MAERIDAHQHFWLYDSSEYSWITEKMRSLQRHFLPEDLVPELKAHGIAGTIAVQARQTVAETEWLLSLAESNSSIAGVVGWMPLCSETLDHQLDGLRHVPWLKGLRHVLQDEPTDELMTSEPFQQGLRVLTRRNLVYDLLIYERQLASVLALVAQHPHQVFVLDHIGKPCIADRSIEPWSKHLHELARHPNVFCKLSGMVTEADWTTWSPTQLRPYFDVVLEAFRPERIMFGSDWPVCLLAASYSDWFGTVEEWTTALSHDEQSALFGGTAKRVYKLNNTPILKGEL